jgi:pimeloyl-ACP methyl ester carboxylesterase
MATFILVHGTFAKSAHWPFLQASLAETARAAGDEPLFEQLTWTGRNRASARLAAASAIFTSVQKIQRASANEKIFLIGHSHGGSAIAYFLKEHPEAAKMLAGCAFLSTPFVAIRPRREAIRLIATLFFIPLLAFQGLWIFPGLSNDDWLNANLAYFLGVLLAPTIVVLPMVFFIRRAGDPQKLAEQSIRQQTANIPAGNYLFLRCSGDEAAAALSAGQFIAWLGMKASKILDLLSRPFFFDPTLAKGRAYVRQIRNYLFYFPMIMAIGYGWYVAFSDIAKLGVFGYFFSPDGPFVGRLKHIQIMLQAQNPMIDILPYITGMVFRLISFVVVSLLLLSLSAVILIFFTQALTSWVFGWTRLFNGFFVELAIEPLPFGEHSLIHIDWASGSTGLDGIVHSWTYAHPVALMHLQSWITASSGKLPMTAVETTTVAPTDERTN